MTVHPDVLPGYCHGLLQYFFLILGCSFKAYRCQAGIDPFRVLDLAPLLLIKFFFNLIVTKRFSSKPILIYQIF